MIYPILLVCAVVFLLVNSASGQGNSPGVTPQPIAPDVLPGKGLAEHDFFYAGEAKAQNMYIVRGGKIAWRYENDKSKGEISDAIHYANGNILFAHQHGITLIDQNKSVLWKHDAPPNTEIHTAQLIGKDRIVWVQNGEPALVIVMNISTGKIDQQFEIKTGNPKSVHGHFRHARLTDAGTLLVAHMDLGQVHEYQSDGKEVATPIAEMKFPGLWSAIRLKNGNTLVCGKAIQELDPTGRMVWQFSATDLPEYKVNQFQVAVRLASGNTLVNNWMNEWSAKIIPETASAQAWEVSPDKKVKWALRSWLGENNLGPATIIQLLDEDSGLENVKFGEFR